jgi:TolA-binding protein
MQNVEEQILAYPHLPVEKQREVEEYVEAHPEWASLLRDVRAIESLGRDDGAAASDSFLTTYVVVQHLHPGEVTPALEAAFRRLEEKMEADASLQERAEAARKRLRDAEASVDPVSQFEALTGHSLEGADEQSAPADATAATREPARDRESASPIGTFIDDLLRLPLAVRWAGAAVALLLGTYVVLFAASQASQSTLDRLASVNVSSQVVDNYTSSATRGAAPSRDTLTADQLYVDALTAVREARTSTFGLFPSYDAEKLDRAEQLLTRVLDRTPSGSFLALEARFYLGKVYLAQEQIEPARASFKTVVQREGRMSIEARDILETLQEEYPVGDRQNPDR